MPPWLEATAAFLLWPDRRGESRQRRLDRCGKIRIGGDGAGVEALGQQGQGKAGFLDQYVSWLSDPTGSFGVTVAAMVWYGQPLMALILLASLQTIPQTLYDAAQVDGASAWQQFRYITLPHLLPSILFLVLLRVIWMSNHIDMIFVLTQGGPGFANYTAAVYSFKLTNQFEIGYASAVAVVLTILLVAASALYVRHLARKVLVSA